MQRFSECCARFRAGVVVLALAALAGSWAAAADEAATDVPDPFGLGERLALIDFLHEQKITVPDGATLEQLRALYRNRSAPPAESEADRRAELVRRLWVEFHRTPPAGATSEQLVDLLNQAKAQQDAALAAEKEREAKDDAAHAGDAAPRPPVAAPPPAEAAPPGQDVAVAAPPAPAPAASATAPPADAPDPPHRDDLVVVYAAVPTFSGDDSKQWKNFALATPATRAYVSLWAYVLTGDKDHYFIRFQNRNQTEMLVVFKVNGYTYRLYIPTGKNEATHQVFAVTAQNYSDSPSIEIVTVELPH
jgi:hypothetical protein